MDELMRALSKYPNGTTIIIEWLNGDMLLGDIDTIYETDNELEPNDLNYKEYYVCLICIKKIISSSGKLGNYSIGDLIEISANNISKISSEDGTLIWEYKRFS